MTSVRDKQDPPNLQLSTEYLLYRWRKEMKTTWNEMLETPWKTILRDLEYLDLEGEYLQEKESK